MGSLDDFVVIADAGVLNLRNYEALMELNKNAAHTTSPSIDRKNQFRLLDRQGYEDAYRARPGEDFTREQVLEMHNLAGEVFVSVNHARILEVAFDDEESRPLVWNAVPTVEPPSTFSETIHGTTFHKMETMLYPWRLDMAVIMTKEKLRNLALKGEWKEMMACARKVRAVLLARDEMKSDGELERRTTEDDEYDETVYVHPAHENADEAIKIMSKYQGSGTVGERDGEQSSIHDCNGEH